MKEIEFNTIAIIGLGLMGGSFGLAVKKNIRTAKIVGISRKKINISLAKKIGAIDLGTTDIKEGVKDADLVVISVPVDKIVSTFKKILPHLKDGCIVTDVGSTKNKIVKEIYAFAGKNHKVYFIGGHPICGSEKQGIKFARDNLYENAPYIFTPYYTPKPKLLSLVRFISYLKCKPVILSPELHDYYIAGISHLPHIIAGCLVRVVGNQKDKNKMLKLAAGGFRDTTRISSSSPLLWKDICLHNKTEILKFLSLFIEEVKNIKLLIEKDRWKEVEKKFLEAKKTRDGLNKNASRCSL